MRSILLGIFELRRYRRGPLGRAAVVAMVLLPLLYGCVYLVAFWNPYNNLSALPVAVVNQDQPVTASGKQVDVGNQLTTTLVNGKQFDWTVTDAATASSGLDNGTYYMVRTIPSSTSADIASLATNQPKPAQLQLTTNNANSYLVSLIAEQASTQITQALTQQVDSQFAATTLSGLQTIRASLVKAAAGAQTLATGLDTANSGAAQLVTGTKEVAAGDQQLATVANDVRSGLSVAESDLKSAVAQAQSYAQSHPTDPIAQKIAQGLVALQAKFDGVVTKADASIAQIDKLGAGSQQVATGMASLAAGITKLDAGAHELATGLQQGVEQIPTYTPAQQAAVAQMVANPVSVDDQTVNASASYGTGFAPYFMPLALWVGTLVAFMMFAPLPMRSRVSQYQSSFGAVITGMTPMVIVGIAQVAVLSIVLRFFVGVHAVHPVLVGGISLLISVVFLAIIQLLMVALGVAGRLVALVLLMLQLCSSGGTYPVALSPWFFKTISPFMPMTYAVDALRRTINGGELSSVVVDCLILAIFGVGAFLLTVLVTTRKRVISMSDLKPEITL